MMNDAKPATSALMTEESFRLLVLNYGSAVWYRDGDARCREYVDKIVAAWKAQEVKAVKSAPVVTTTATDLSLLSKLHRKAVEDVEKCIDFQDAILKASIAKWLSEQIAELNGDN